MMSSSIKVMPEDPPLLANSPETSHCREKFRLLEPSSLRPSAT